jgi:hypothetical protein
MRTDVTNPQVLPNISGAVRDRLDALKVGEAYDSPVPDDVRDAIHAGHVGQVSIYCDECGSTETMDCTGVTREGRFGAAREHLVAVKGWHCDSEADLCPNCKGGTA